MLVPVGGLQRAVVKALQYARTLSTDVRALYVELDPAATAAVRAEWDRWGQAPTSSCSTHPIGLSWSRCWNTWRRFNARTRWIRHRHPAGVRPAPLWHHLFHNQHALLIKGALLFKPNIIVTSVPFHLGAGPGDGPRRLSNATRAGCRRCWSRTGATTPPRGLQGATTALWPHALLRESVQGRSFEKNLTFPSRTKFVTVTHRSPRLRSRHAAYDLFTTL